MPAKVYEKPTTNKLLDRMRMNPLLSWLSDMVQLFSHDIIATPKDYRGRVLAVREALENDISGYVNGLLDYAINSASVDYYIETDNDNLTDKLNNWLSNINIELRGEVPVGIKSLLKEYCRERWKGSSFLVLRTFWEKVDGFEIPTLMYFMQGEDIIVGDGEDETKNLKPKKYYLRIDDDNKKPIGTKENEKLFIQKPFTPWGEPYPIPFVIQRGIWKNLKFLELLEERGEFLVSKAIEYLAILKKGDKDLTLSNNPDFIYSEADLKKVKEDFKQFLDNRRVTGGTSTYVTNFDTTLEHSIPEYARILKEELYAPIERRILGGLGLIDIVEGVASARREAILNPKPFFGEIKNAVQEFKLLLSDILYTIVERNKPSHKKYFNVPIRISNTTVIENITDKVLSQIRSGYDRGVVSKRSYDESLGLELDVEIKRRKDEKPLTDTMYPPVIQNQEQIMDETTKQPITKKEKTTPDKTGPEKKNYNKSEEEKQ